MADPLLLGATGVVSALIGAGAAVVLLRRKVAADRSQADRAMQAAEAQKLELDRARTQAGQELQRVSSLTQEEAREEVLARVRSTIEEEARQVEREVSAKSAAKWKQEARHKLLTVMERTAADLVCESTTAIVPLPSDEMKGRLIGREGRNIRVFESVTGADLIVDDTPEAVLISCFDPTRREIARLTLANLILDGRIHPARIEELHAKAQNELDQVMLEAAEEAAQAVGVNGLHAEVSQAMGHMRFRTSQGQNLLDHSVEVARLGAGIAQELGLNVEVTARAGLLHDVGKAVAERYDGPHALAGMEFLREFGESPEVLLAVGAHHREIEPKSLESQAVIVADSLSAARPGARRDSLEFFLRRVEDLERIASAQPGVSRAYAIKAGRDLRVVVRPEQIDDLGAKRLAQSLASQIDRDLGKASGVKVTVIRETRATEIVP